MENSTSVVCTFPSLILLQSLRAGHLLFASAAWNEADVPFGFQLLFRALPLTGDVPNGLGCGSLGDNQLLYISPGRLWSSSPEPQIPSTLWAMAGSNQAGAFSVVPWQPIPQSSDIIIMIGGFCHHSPFHIGSQDCGQITISSIEPRKLGH